MASCSHGNLVGKQGCTKQNSDGMFLRFLNGQVDGHEHGILVHLFLSESLVSSTCFFPHVFGLACRASGNGCICISDFLFLFVSLCPLFTYFY